MLQEEARGEEKAEGAFLGNAGLKLSPKEQEQISSS